MEAKELRIGNYLYYKDKPTAIEVHEIETIEERQDHSYKPIPLTEEWLLKFGFEHKRTEKADNYYLDHFRITFTDKKNIYIVYANSLSFKYNKYYVHQLQNLYFALTGEELC